MAVIFKGNNIENLLYLNNSIDRIYRNNAIVYEKSSDNGIIAQTINFKQNNVGSRPYNTMCDGELYLNDGTFVDQIKTITNVTSNPASCKFTYLQNGVELGTVEMTANCGVYGSETMTTPFVLDGTRPYSNYRWMEFEASALDINVTFVITPKEGVDKAKQVRALVLGYMDRYDISVGSTATSYRYMSAYLKHVNSDTVLFDYNTQATVLDAASIKDDSGKMIKFGCMIITSDKVKLAYYNPVYGTGLTLDHKLYLKDLGEPTVSHEKTIDEIMALDRYDGLYDPRSELETTNIKAEIVIGNNLASQTQASLNAGALFEGNDIAIPVVFDSTAVSDNSDIIAANIEYAKVSSDTNVLSDYQASFLGLSNNYKTAIVLDSTKKATITTKSATLDYLAISPLNVEASSNSGGLLASVSGGYDYYKFSFYNGGGNICPEQLKIHLKDGTTLIYLGYESLSLNQNNIDLDGTNKADNLMYAIFTRDQSASYPSHGPDVTQVSYDKNNTNLVKIKVLAANCYTNSTNNVMNLFCMNAGYVYGSYYYAYGRSSSKDLDVYLCLTDDSNFSWDEVDRFSITNYLDAYSYTSYGFRRLKYHRVCIQDGSIIKDFEFNWTENKQNYSLEAIKGIVINTEPSSSTYLSINGTKIFDYATLDELNSSETKTVRGTEYVSRYIIEMTSKKYKKCWIPKKVADIGNCYIYNKNVDRMVKKSISKIFANNYVNGETDEVGSTVNKFKLTLNSDRGYSGYSAFYLAIPVINGVAYECVECSRYESVSTSSGETSPTYYKLRGLADVSTDEGRLAFVNRTANSVSYSTSGGTIFKVTSGLNETSACEDNEIIVKMTFNNRWNSSSEYQSGYVFKAIKNTYPWYVLFSSSVSDSWLEAQIMTGQTIDGMIIVPYSTNTHGGRMNYHNIIELKDNNDIIMTIENEISGTSTSSFVDNRGFFVDVLSNSITPIN